MAPQIRTLRIASLLTPAVLAFGLVGCGSENSHEPIESDRAFGLALQPAAGEDPRVFEAVSSVDNLTVDQWAIYRADRAYVHTLVPPNTSVALNHADPRQHRFVLQRLRLAGKTPQNSPRLFEQVEELRAHHEAIGLAVGSLAAVDPPVEAEAAAATGLAIAAGDPVALAGDNGTSHSTQHFFSSLDLLPNGENDPVVQEVLATSSAMEDAFYSYLDAAAWDKNGTPLGDMVWTDTYGPMPFTTLATTGDLSLTPHDELEADSVLYQDLVGNPVPRSRYMRGPQRRGPRFEDAVITGPVDSTGDECVSVCLNRVWTGDCDYDITGSPGALALPLSGCIDIMALSQTPYSFSQTQIDDWATNGCNDDCGQIRVTLQDVGGGCNVDQNSSLYGSMQDFWQSVTLSNGGETMRWDMTGANVMTFDPSCRQVQDAIELTMTLPLPWEHLNGSQGATVVALTNNEQATDPELPCISVTNSCLAAGTMVEMSSGGAAVPIESIEAGTMASSPFADDGLTVMDTARGTEAVPMVRIGDAAGHSLLLTRKHPVLVPGRGMVQAEDLQVGDSVMTKAGKSVLTSVAEEQYDGYVHNLKVGSEAEARGLSADQTVFYANGIVVGDGQIQSKYESIERKAQKAVDIRTYLPQSWMQDYDNSVRRAAAQRRAR